MYFRLLNSSNGDVYLKTYETEGELLKELEEEVQESDRETDFTEKLDKFNSLSDSMFDIILKGELVVPEPKKVVKSFKLS